MATPMLLALLTLSALGRAQDEEVRVTVRVVSARDDSPLDGARVWLREAEGPRAGRVLDANEGEVGDLLTTDLLGEVVFRGRPDRALSLQVQGAPIEFGDHEQALEALGANEQVTVVVRLEPGERRPFHGVLRDRATGEPIVGARVHTPRSQEWVTLGSRAVVPQGTLWSPVGEALATTDSQGRFELEWRSWRTDWVHVFTDDHSALGFAVTGARADPARAKELRIPRAAALQGHYWDAEGIGVADVRVDVVLRSWNLYLPGPTGGVPGTDGVRWETRTDEQGRFELAGLPAGTTLTLTLSDARGGRLHTEELTLEPGERRDVSTSARTEHAVRGVLLDEQGNPLAGVDVQLGPAREGQRGHGYLSPYGDGLRRTRTDAEGRFAFDGVALGRWIVGVRPPPPPWKPTRWAPFGRQIHVPLGHALTLTGYDGYVTGRVVDEAGEPLAGVGLYASVRGCFGSLRADSERDGSFRLGPMGPEEHGIHVVAHPDGPESGWACTRTLRARAGDEALEFRMVRTGVLVGRAVDGETGAAVEAEFTVRPEEGSGGSMLPRALERARFRWLAPGSYSLIASTGDGRIGVLSGIEVRRDETTTDQVVVLQRGGRLKLAPGESGAFAVHQDGAWVGWLSASGRPEIVVPAGTMTVVRTERGEPVGEERPVEVTAGATVVFSTER